MHWAGVFFQPRISAINLYLQVRIVALLGAHVLMD